VAHQPQYLELVIAAVNAYSPERAAKNTVKTGRERVLHFCE